MVPPATFGHVARASIAEPAAGSEWTVLYTQNEVNSSLIINNHYRLPVEFIMWRAHRSTRLSPHRPKMSNSDPAATEERVIVRALDLHRGRGVPAQIGHEGGRFGKGGRTVRDGGGLRAVGICFCRWVIDATPALPRFDPPRKRDESGRVLRAVCRRVAERVKDLVVGVQSAKRRLGLQK